MNRRTFLSSTAAAAAAAQLAPRALAAAPKANAATAPQPPKLAPRFGDGRDWWFQKRFPMFVHWGLYAI